MLSLYIHIPYCVKKCNYCGFYSTTYSAKDADVFLTALALESEQRRNEVSGRSFASVYIGGGTPTVLSIHQLDRLFHIVRNSFNIDNGAEFTMEANPYTASGECFSFLRQQGVNRLSLGVQSFSDKTLDTLGRLHTAREAREGFIAARKAGFENIGVDLLFGVPGQTKTEWNDTLEAAFALGPEHISAYSLSLDEGSRFYDLAKNGAFALPDDAFVAGMYEYAVRKMSPAGYHRYEISNFSRAGFECRHNRNYWNRGEYVGLGPGAASFLAEKRSENIRDTALYVARLQNGDAATEFEETLRPESIVQETLMLGMRMAIGVDLSRLENAIGASLPVHFLEAMHSLASDGLLVREGGFVRLTERGFLLSDHVLTRLYI